MKINEHEISIIIPAYNAENTIIDVLEAIYKQTKRQYIKEIIVVNDGSSDNTVNMVENYPKQDGIILRLINQKNMGVSAARNIGMMTASGKWLALCDADDRWLRDKIEFQVKTINSHDKIDFLGGNHTRKTQKIIYKSVDHLTKIDISTLCFKVIPQTSTVIFKKEIFDSLGGYDEGQSYAEDANFFMKIAANYNYYYDPKQVVQYGFGKRGFGDGGLSGNISKMHAGFLKNFSEMKKLGYISNRIYIAAVLFENLKYLRRKVIVNSN